MSNPLTCVTKVLVLGAAELYRLEGALFSSNTASGARLCGAAARVGQIHTEHKLRIMPGVKSARRNDARANNSEKKIKICVSVIPDPVGKPFAGGDACARYDGDYFANLLRLKCQEEFGSQEDSGTVALLPVVTAVRTSLISFR